VSPMSDEQPNWAVPTCGSCGSRLIHRTGGRETNSTLWEVDLRCPDCEGRQVSYYTRAELEQLDRQLNRDTSEMEQELSRIESLHMEEWAARFAQALDLDLIGPDDF
jgi:ribosomal protein S27E